MFEAYASAVQILFQPVNLLIILGATVLGLVVGAIPGIGGLVFIPILLPFVTRIPVEGALLLLVAFYAVLFTGGSITAILVNIPGTSPNAATTIDGFPMTQKGQGGRALGAAITSSVAGGAVPVFLAMALIAAILPILLAFGQPEMAALVLLGISFLAALSGKSVVKGVIAGMAGLLISSIGYHSITGVHRFTFNTTFLYDGIQMVPLIIGLFGLSELFDLMMRGQKSIAQSPIAPGLSDIFSGVRDVWRHKWLWFRSAVIGFVTGAIPGIGAEIATWVAYGQAKQTSKYPEKFGTGLVEGVIAPEAANNAKEASSLLTTMAFGIPGSTIMAIFLGAFFMLGLSPGPTMIGEHLPLALALLLCIALANLLGGIISLFAAPSFVKLSSVNFDFLFPAVLIVSMAGVYVATQSPLNLIIALTFGLLGLVMKRYEYSRPALLLGFVLGGLFENYTLLSIKIYGPLLFARPITLTLIAITIIMLNFAHIRRLISHFKQRRKRK